MNKHFTPNVLLFLCLLLPMVTMAQLQYSCSYSPRIAIAGDSWAQYMADDYSHNKMFNMYGQGDKGAISQTYETLQLCPDTYNVGDYAVSGSEARQWRQWADDPDLTKNYLQNLINALQANPTVTTVLLSIGGNDILAARSGGGWYRNMDADVPGSEQALFETVQGDTEFIMERVWDVLPNMNFVISSYDFPNLNVGGLYCGLYACDKREDLSRDDNGNGSIDGSELITDAEISAMMSTVEAIRKGMADAHPQIFYDNSMGLMHYYYGYDDGLYSYIPSGTTPYPGGQSPYTPGGDFSTPTDRDNFRGVAVCGIGSFSADPIHLDADAYEYKIKNQFDNLFFEEFRGVPNETFWSVGSEDGYVDLYEGTASTDGIRVGDNGWAWFTTTPIEFKGILSFNTAPLPDDAVVTGASLYIIRSGEDDNPFLHNDRNPVLDIKNGYFGDNAALQGSDGTAAADASDIGCFHGNAAENKFAIRVDLSAPALEHFNVTGTTQLRLSFDYADWSPEYINFYDGNGTAGFLPPDVEQRQNPIIYKYRTVKESFDRDGNIKEEVIEQREPIQKEEGYVYQEKLKEVTQNDDGETIKFYQTVVAIEHEGLARYMSENYNAPANGRAPFLDITYDLAVPVELTTFTAKGEDQSALLDWETASESNTFGFYIEHSANGRDWEDLGFVVASGDSESVKRYEYIDEDPVLANNYYRLRITDVDDTYEYSEVRLVKFGKENLLTSIYPNPFKDRLTLELEFEQSGTASIQLSDVLGRLVVDRSINVVAGAQKYYMEDLAGLNKGTYVVRVFDGEEVFVGKVVKE